MQARFMILAGLALSLSTACVSSLVMDTGRALPKGESTLTVGAAAGWQEGELIAYEKPTYDPLPVNEPFVEISEGRQWPLWNFQAEWGVRYSYGLGAGLQTDFLVSAPTPVGLGAGVGLKWQLPWPSSELFAVALATRGVASAGGNSSAGNGASFLLLSADIGPIVSVHPHEFHALYFSPRVRSAMIHHRIWSDPQKANTTGSGTWFDAALGWRLGRGHLQGFFIEGNMGYAPQTDRDDGWRVTLGVGGIIGKR